MARGVFPRAACFLGKATAGVEGAELWSRGRLGEEGREDAGKTRGQDDRGLARQLCRLPGSPEDTVWLEQDQGTGGVTRPGRWPAAAQGRILGYRWK